MFIPGALQSFYETFPAITKKLPVPMSFAALDYPCMSSLTTAAGPDISKMSGNHFYLTHR